MWCSTCQQDVPGLGSPGLGRSLRCGKCGQSLTHAASTPSRHGRRIRIGKANRAENASLERVLAVADDDWRLEAELQGVRRMVHAWKGNPLGSCEAGLVYSQRPELPGAERPSKSTVTNERPATNLLAWFCLSIGLAIFACGAVLLGWSFAAERDDLWPIGLPLALVGQAGLIVGLVLQLDSLRQGTQQTANSLSDLDQELSRVRHATTLLTTSHSPSAQSFYAHMAEGASPQLLLADLKGQLDLLAQQMSKK